MKPIFVETMPFTTLGSCHFFNRLCKPILGKDQQGHCNFTQQQTAKAFDELRTWVKTGMKAKAGLVE